MQICINIFFFCVCVEFTEEFLFLIFQQENDVSIVEKKTKQ